MLAPVFIKGQLAVRFQDHNLEFQRKNISIFGVTGLPWGPLNALQHFGKPAEVSVKVASDDGYTFKSSALIMREYTLYSEHMGIRLLLEQQDRDELAKRISRHGFFPTDYIRKYPRIPSDPRIQTFPLHVMGTLESSEQPIVFGVKDLSPNGLLVSTENQAALKMTAGERLNIVIDPRGWFPAQIRCQAMVCRITDDLDAKTGNLTRYVGLRFSKIDDFNKASFLDLMKDILARLKDNQVPVAIPPA
jgi:hypothetical protein